MWVAKVTLHGRVVEAFRKKGLPGRPQSAYSNNRSVNKCGWRRWIMLDGSQVRHVEKRDQQRGQKLLIRTIDPHSLRFLALSSSLL